MSKDTPARRLIGGAFAFLRAAELLSLDDPQALAWATCFVNIGFAIELGLKSYLRATHGTEKEQIGLGHDLLRAFEAAEERGFKPSHPGARIIALELSPFHKDMSLRYLVGSSVTLPRVDEVVPAVRLLLVDLHRQGASAQQAL